MDIEDKQIIDMIKAATKATDILQYLGEWKPGDPYMEEHIGNIRFIGWCDEFGNQIRKICSACPCQVKHPDIWLNKEHTEGVPSNILCAKYTKQIGSCYDTVQVARVCKYMDPNVFEIYVKEYDAYCQWWEDKLKEKQGDK